MGLISKLFGLSQPRRREGAKGTEAPQEPAGPGASRRRSVFDAYGGNALTVATAYRCVRILSESVANLPMRYMRLRGPVFEATRGRLAYLLAVQPDTHMSAYDFWRQLVVRLLMDGNAYVVPVWGMEDGEFVMQRLVLCDRGTVSQDYSTDTYTVNDYTNGLSGKYHERDIIHIKALSGDGRTGMSVLTHARLTLNVATAGDRETCDRFTRGGNMRGLVTNNRSAYRGLADYDDGELGKVADNIDELFDNGAHLVSLPGDVDLKQLTFSSSDMQFLESRKFTVREVCRFFGVPPTFVFDDTSNNYKSAEQANVTFLSQALDPLLKAIENEFLRKLVPESLAFRRKFEFDRRGLYSCDLASRADYQTKRLANGTATVNELRAEENLPPVEGGDTPFVSANLRPVAEAATRTSQPQQPQEPQEPQEPQQPTGSDE